MINENISSNRKIHRNAREKIKRLKQKCGKDIKKDLESEIEIRIINDRACSETENSEKKIEDDLKNDSSEEIGFFKRIFGSFKRNAIKEKNSESEYSMETEISSITNQEIERPNVNLIIFQKTFYKQKFFNLFLILKNIYFFSRSFFVFNNKIRFRKHFVMAQNLN